MKYRTSVLPAARATALWLHATALLTGIVILGLAALLAPRLAQAQSEIDPPGRVGRISDLAGGVWWFDLEQGRWSDAERNRPITSGDRLSTGRDAQAELRIGSSTIKLAESTEVELLRLDDERVRIQLHRGSIALRLRSREVAAETEFGTDEAWLRPLRGGLYRLDRDDDTTFASVWRGEARVDGDTSLDIDTGRRVQLWREGRQRQLQHRWAAPIDDAFAARVLRDERDDERTASAAYVSPEMTGFEDLDRNGRWDQHPDYGAVWFPSSVSADWAPYRHGRWAWVRPWGWTWIDAAPWGFAPFHYGRWVTWRDRWGWVPGSYVARPVYAPALVAWIDGPAAGIGLRVGGPTLSWVALAPWELFRPHYRVSPGYHDRVNSPDHRRWRPPSGWRYGGQTYGNQGVPNAVTVVPSDVLRPRPPAVRDGRDGHDGRDGREGARDDRRDDRDRERGRDRDRDGDRRDDPRPRPRDPDGQRPGADVRPPPPPPTRPIAPLVPMPTRPQPVQPSPHMQPPAPPPPQPVQPPPARPPQPARDDRQHRPPAEPRGRGQVPATAPPPPPPPQVTSPGPTAQPPAVRTPPPQPPPRAPAPAEPRPPQPRDKDQAKEEPRNRPNEPRGGLR